MMGLEIELKNASEALKVRPGVGRLLLSAQFHARKAKHDSRVGFRPGMKPPYHCLQAVTSSCVMLHVRLL